MNECSYRLSDDPDDGYSAVACDLLVGHEGPHHAEFTWTTRPVDICEVSGHDWGEWEPYAVSPNYAAWWIVYAAWWIVVPTKQRHCRRCRRVETDGRATRLYPVLTPFRNALERPGDET